MKKSANSKERQVFLCSRRGVILVALIAVIVLVINLITASYSWFTPQQDKKGRPAPLARHCVAGNQPVLRHDYGEHPLRQAGCHR